MGLAKRYSFFYSKPGLEVTFETALQNRKPQVPSSAYYMDDTVFSTPRGLAQTRPAAAFHDPQRRGSGKSQRLFYYFMLNMFTDVGASHVA